MLSCLGRNSHCLLIQFIFYVEFIFLIILINNKTIKFSIKNFKVILASHPNSINIQNQNQLKLFLDPGLI